MVAALEPQYDAFIDAQESWSLLRRDEDLPSGDELGAEFERFWLTRQRRSSTTTRPERPDLARL